MSRAARSFAIALFVKPPAYYESSADAVEADLGGFLEGVLPDADDFPSLAADLTGDVAVAGHVGLAFAVPKCTVGPRAAVPRTKSVGPDAEDYRR